jgi:hypothetical protein
MERPWRQRPWRCSGARARFMFCNTNCEIADWESVLFKENCASCDTFSSLSDATTGKSRWGFQNCPYCSGGLLPNSACEETTLAPTGPRPTRCLVRGRAAGMPPGAREGVQREGAPTVHRSKDPSGATHLRNAKFRRLWRSLACPRAARAEVSRARLCVLLFGSTRSR